MERAELEFVEDPAPDVEARWQRVPARGWPAFYLDVGPRDVGIWEQANPRDSYGNRVTRRAFLEGEHHDLVVSMLGEEALQAALAWLRGDRPLR